MLTSQGDNDMFNHHSLFFRCVKLQFGGEETQNEAWSWLAANQLSSFVNTKESRFDFIHLNFNDSKEFRHLSFFLLKIFLLLHASSATDEAWRLLASYLDRFSSSNAQYHRCVINKLLSHGVPLPDWLVKSYKVRDLPIERGETVDVDGHLYSDQSWLFSHDALLCISGRGCCVSPASLPELWPAGRCSWAGAGVCRRSVGERTPVLWNRGTSENQHSSTLIVFAVRMFNVPDNLCSLIQTLVSIR